MAIAAENKIKRQDLVITRILDAPVDRVWKAWTDPSLMVQWWGPQHYTSPSARIDLRVGGKYVLAMRSPLEMGKRDSFSAGIYRKIILRQLLEFTQSLSDREGNPVEPRDVGMPSDFPKEILTVVAFKSMGLMTELTITEHDWPVGHLYIYSLAGMHQSIDKLAGVLAKH